MAEIVFITGGARSGKSAFAQSMAEKLSDNPVYMATARIWDDDFGERIQRHKNERNQSWQTIEEEKNISKHNLDGRTVMLDCITLWLTNIFHDNNYDIDKSLTQAKTEWLAFILKDMTLIVVSNEIGMGVHAENAVSRKFCDLQGWINQYIAAKADSVYFMVSGIAMKIK